jgi:hypothetical protein
MAKNPENMLYVHELDENEIIETYKIMNENNAEKIVFPYKQYTEKVLGRTHPFSYSSLL